MLLLILSIIFSKTEKKEIQKGITSSEAVVCALQLYQQKKAERMNFSSQCLGTCYDYAVDIVHVPRNEEDNKIENQCLDYRKGRVKHFIELDKDGSIFRIV